MKLQLNQSCGFFFFFPQENLWSPETPLVKRGPSGAALEGCPTEHKVKYNTSVTDPPNNKALTEGNDSMITHKLLKSNTGTWPTLCKEVIFHDIFPTNSSGTCFISSFFPLLLSLLMKTGTIRTATHMVLDLQVWLFLIPRIKALIRLMERQSSGGTVVFIRNPFREQRDSNRLFVQSADSRVPLSSRSRLYRYWKNVCKEHKTGLKWGAVVYIFGVLSRLLVSPHQSGEREAKSNTFTCLWSVCAYWRWKRSEVEDQSTFQGWFY